MDKTKHWKKLSLYFKTNVDKSLLRTPEQNQYEIIN